MNFDSLCITLQHNPTLSSLRKLSVFPFQDLSFFLASASNDKEMSGFNFQALFTNFLAVCLGIILLYS
jgi:hypothetical protein